MNMEELLAELLLVPLPQPYLLRYLDSPARVGLDFSSGPPASPFL